MRGLSNSTNQKRFSAMRSIGLSLPVVWPAKRPKPEQVNLVPHALLDNQPLPPSRRLVVILPDADVDLLPLSKQIWDLAAPDHRQVLLMSKPCLEEDESHARVNLSTLAAFIGDSSVVVQTQLVLGRSLVQAACQCAQPDDIFVCFEGHWVSNFLEKRRLAEIIAQIIPQPVYTLDETVPEMVNPLTVRLMNFLNLAICIISLVAFFALEVWIDQNSNGTLQSILQILAVFAEVWFIGVITRKSFQI
jgi:hypothetical protein